MKKLGMLIVMLIFAGTPFVMAQQQTVPNQQRKQKVSPVREYIQKNVLPVVKQESAKFISVLTPAEKKELTKIQEELKASRGENMRPGPGMRGNFHRPMMQNQKGQMPNLFAQVKKIADAHPKAAAAYKKAVEAKTAIWAKAIKEIREKNGMGYGHGMNNNRPPFILDRISDPAFGLLFDGTHFPMGMRPGMGPGRAPGMRGGNFDPKGMKGRGPMAMGMSCPMTGRNMGNHSQWKGRGYGQNRGYRNQKGYGRFQMRRHPGMMMKAMNPEVKKEMLAYAQKNIFPVLNKQREAFNNVLKSSEKRDIENARKNIAGIRAEMQKHWQEMKKGQGQKLSDSARMAQRLNLEKNMLTVREIALRHYGELQATLKNLKQYLPKWKEGMRHIVFQNMNKNGGFHHPMNRPGFGRMMPPKGYKMMKFHRNHKMMSPGIRFLLYDPAHPGEHLFPMGK